MSKLISLFGAASDRISSKKKKQAYAVGRLLAQSGVSVVYGAGDKGVMGAFATGFIENDPQGLLIGTTTDYLYNHEGAFQHPQVPIAVCNSIEDRKKLYYKSDAVLVLPGGIGTGSELLDFLTHAKLSSDIGRKVEWAGPIWLWDCGINRLWMNLFEQMYKEKMTGHCDWHVELVNYERLRNKSLEI